MELIRVGHHLSEDPLVVHCMELEREEEEEEDISTQRHQDLQHEVMREVFLPIRSPLPVEE